jgi:hypothetical protein
VLHEDLRELLEHLRAPLEGRGVLLEGLGVLAAGDVAVRDGPRAASEGFARTGSGPEDLTMDLGAPRAAVDDEATASAKCPAVDRPGISFLSSKTPPRLRQRQRFQRQAGSGSGCGGP